MKCPGLIFLRLLWSYVCKACWQDLAYTASKERNPQETGSQAVPLSDGWNTPTCTLRISSAEHFGSGLWCWRLDQTPSAALRVHDESVLVVIGTTHRDIVAHRCLDSLKQTPHLYSSDPLTFQKCSKHMEWPFSSPYTNRQNKNSKHSSHHQPPGLTITPFLISLELDFRSEVLWKAGSWIPAYMEFDF